MSTTRNPILIGQAEVIDVLLPEVRTMLQRQGIYLASDSARPGYTVPLLVNAEGVWSMEIDGRLDPERFHKTVRISGPFFAPGEEIDPVSAKDAAFAAAQIDERAVMCGLADRIVGNAAPDEDGRLEVAYAIARYLGLDWPAAAPRVDLREGIALILRSEFDMETADPEDPRYDDGHAEALRIADKIVELGIHVSPEGNSRRFELTNGQIAQLADFGGTPVAGAPLDEQDVLVIRHADAGHSGPGLYAHYDELPEEGAIYLDGQLSACPQGGSDAPNLFWNDADPERAFDSITELVSREWSNGAVEAGDVMEIQQAIRLPNIKVRVVESEDDGVDYEAMKATIAEVKP